MGIVSQLWGKGKEVITGVIIDFGRFDKLRMVQGWLMGERHSSNLLLLLLARINQCLTYTLTSHGGKG
jgi:hypothetical protein